MAFFHEVAPKRNLAGEGFLTGFQSGLSQSNEENSIRRQHYLQDQLYQEDYKRSLPTLEKIYNSDMPIDKKLFELEKSMLPQHVKKNGQQLILAQEKGKKNLNFLKTAESVNKEVEKQLGVNNLIGFDKLSDEQKKDYGEINRIAIALVAQGHVPASAVQLAKEMNEGEKSKILQQQDQQAAARNKQQGEEEKAFFSLPIEQQAKLVLQEEAPQGDKIRALKEIGYTTKEALDIVKGKEDSKKVSERIIKENLHKKRIQESRPILREIVNPKNKKVPEKAKRFAIEKDRTGELLSPETIDRLEKMGLDEEIIRHMRKVKRSATKEELTPFYENNATDQAIEKWLEERYLEA